MSRDDIVDPEDKFILTASSTLYVYTDTGQPHHGSGSIEEDGKRFAEFFRKHGSPMFKRAFFKDMERAKKHANKQEQ